jgi:hypothetical protein
MPGRLGGAGRLPPLPAGPLLLSRRMGLPTSSRGVGLGRPVWLGRVGAGVPERWGPVGRWLRAGRLVGGAGLLPPPAWPLTGLATSWGRPPGRLGCSGLRLGAGAAGRAGLEAITTGGLLPPAGRGWGALGRAGAGAGGRVGAGRAEMAGLAGLLAAGAGGRAGAAAGLGALGRAGAGADAAGLAGGADTTAGLAGGATGVGLGTVGGLTGRAAAGRAGGAGLAGGAGWALAMGLGVTGLAGAAAAGGVADGPGVGGAFFTVRMALAGPAAGAAEPLPPFSSSFRIRAASSSLIELLWLLAATPSCSAASSTSLFSRPRSRDSS